MSNKKMIPSADCIQELLRPVIINLDTLLSFLFGEHQIELIRKNAFFSEKVTRDELAKARQLLSEVSDLCAFKEIKDSE